MWVTGTLPFILPPPPPPGAAAARGKVICSAGACRRLRLIRRRSCPVPRLFAPPSPLVLSSLDDKQIMRERVCVIAFFSVVFFQKRRSKRASRGRGIHRQPCFGSGGAPDTAVGFPWIGGRTDERRASKGRVSPKEPFTRM